MAWQEASGEAKQTNPGGGVGLRERGLGTWPIGEDEAAGPSEGTAHCPAVAQLCHSTALKRRAGLAAAQRSSYYCACAGHIHPFLRLKLEKSCCKLSSPFPRPFSQPDRPPAGREFRGVERGPRWGVGGPRRTLETAACRSLVSGAEVASRP